MSVTDDSDLRLAVDNQLKSHGETIRLEGVEKKYGPFTALKKTDLEIREGEFFSILGPSGSGKSTLLKLIGGFETPTSGSIQIGSTDVTGMTANKRPVATVFQSYALFPHLTVEENVGFGLRAQKVPLAERTELVRQFLAMVNLTHKAETLPKRLSGGEQQRVALARALAVKPRILLLDEPLGALDLKLREAMQEQLRLLHKAIGSTFVMVTHDQDEAMSVADRVAVMRSGEICEIAAPATLYQSPRSEFAGRFVGAANILECDIVAGSGGQKSLVRSGIKLHTLSGPDAADRTGRVQILIRPENISLSQPSGGLVNGVVRDNLFINGTNIVIIDTPIGVLRSRSFGEGVSSQVASGSSVSVGWEPDNVVVLERT